MLGGIGGGGERVDVGRGADHLEGVAKPLHGCTGHEDRAFERVGAVAGELVGDSREQAMLRRHRFCPGVEQRKAAGAVGRLHHARIKAALPDGRRLLIPGDTQDRNRATEQIGRAEGSGAVADLRQQRHRNAEELAEIGVPTAAPDVHQQGARGIGRVGDVQLAAGQPPQQERVDRAEREPTRFRRGARALDMVEQPGELGGGEIRIEQQPRRRGDHLLVAGASQRRAGVDRAPILPNDRVVDWAAGLPIPDDRGLTLIGDADRCNVAGIRAGHRQRIAHGRERRRPDLFWIVLHQAGRGIDLRDLLLRTGDRRQRSVEQDRARRGRALIDGKQIVRQARPPAQGDR